MKRVWQILVLATLVVGVVVVPAGWLFAQHQHRHGCIPAAQQKPEAMAPIMAQQQRLEKLVADLIESFDKVRTSEDPTQRQAAMEEHARLLAEFREAFQQHHAAMTEHMKMCPMMQKSATHQPHPEEK